MIDIKKVEELIQDRISALNNGLFVVDVSISPANVISVELDKHEGGVSVEDCVAVSRNIEHNLDRETQDFELTVSSAGIDRPLRVMAQYVKNVGRNVRVVLKDGTQYEGTLKYANETQIVIETIKKHKKETLAELHELLWEAIKETKLLIAIK